MLSELADANPALAAKIVDRAGNTKLASKLLMRLAGDGQKVLRALARQGRRAPGKPARQGEGFMPLVSRFKNYAKVEDLLGKVESAEKLVALLRTEARRAWREEDESTSHLGR
jgi:hypothetical protein